MICTPWRLILLAIGTLVAILFSRLAMMPQRGSGVSLLFLFDNDVMKIRPHRLASDFSRNSDADVEDSARMSEKQNGEQRLVSLLEKKNFTIRVHHIPKTGGSSLVHELEKMEHGNLKVIEHEDCVQSKFDATDVNLCMFRDPIDHVFSQFLHGKYNRRAREKYAKQTAFPFETFDIEGDLKGFDKWLKHFNPTTWQLGDGAFGMYNPINMQTRVLTCKYVPTTRSNHDILTEVELSPDLKLAELTLANFDWFGVTELFVESICLLKFQLQGRIPQGCSCNSSERLKVEHRRHHLPKRDSKDISSSMKQRIDDMTKLDRALYRRALELLIDRIHIVERSTGTKILCQKWK